MLLSRNNISIFWFGWNNHYFACPIPKSLFQKFPLSYDVNYSAAFKAVDKTIEYSNMKEALDYELGLRRDYCSTVFKNYDKTKNFTANILRIFEAHGVDYNLQQGHARNLEDYMNEYSSLLVDKSVKQTQKEMLHKLDYMNKVYDYEYVNFWVELKEGSMPQMFFHKYAFQVEKPHLIPSVSMFDMVDCEVKGFNLYCFCPEQADRRNNLMIYAKDGLGNEMLNDLDLSLFHPRIVYSNKRPIESLLAALIGRDLVINYLNCLTEEL